ncbi:MAG TPA: multidrug efflux SMR transporter [Pirellulaceae bacterium]|nr:multidrug efflux SMR transporter [Pirellulaceae bacterium]
MAWFYLLLAGLLEIAWAIGMKYAAKHPRYWPMILVFLLSIGSFLLLARAMRDLPLSTSYAVWTGIGALGAALAGVLLFDESADLRRLIFVALVIAGIVGLKMTSGEKTLTSLPSAAPTSSPSDKPTKAADWQP